MLNLKRPGLLHESRVENCCHLYKSWGLFCFVVKAKRRRRKGKEKVKKQEKEESLIFI